MRVLLQTIQGENILFDKLQKSCTGAQLGNLRRLRKNVFQACVAAGENLLRIMLQNPLVAQRERTGFDCDARGIPDEPADSIDAGKRSRARVEPSRAGWDSLQIQKPELFHS